VVSLSSGFSTKVFTHLSCPHARYILRQSHTSLLDHSIHVFYIFKLFLQEIFLDIFLAVTIRFIIDQYVLILNYDFRILTYLALEAA
jgi:hypothetical protein